MKPLDPFNETEAAIFKLQDEIFEKNRQLATLRRSFDPKPMPDYKFETQSSDVTLSSLFGDRDELIVIMNMGTKCRYCTLWADGFNGVIQHLENRAAFVVHSPDDPETQRAFANDRGWKFKMISGAASPFAQEIGFQSEKGVLPGVLTFKKDSNGKVALVGRDTFGPGDYYCATWYLFDLLPERKWEPRYQYFEKD